ncbi:MAG: SO_0444 family Cu/Zn efflux transporter [Candidatus Electrothrix aestuarii]|uniref:SO_0444 family Cu/Zn efflux transporter n=1 Tax=Candidatus Electrothrix aestuarii TaxID=3062594 RepID=A0AAU8LTV4_9BACT|nr:SO_0444 family Cu/Zn efflux transporter [Candidatus Electrothrix aestuarii]
MSFIYDALFSSWTLLNQSALYMLFGLLIGGLLKEYLSPTYVANHLGTGRFSSVFKAALLGIPIPLCSCGVLPAAATLKKQGANNGAVTAFLISTPESGIDSLSITWALLDPLMTVARPISAFFSAAVAGIAENFFAFPSPGSSAKPAGNQKIEHSACACASGCCGGDEQRKNEGISSNAARKKGFLQEFPGKLKSGIRYAIFDIWEELAGWFMVGILLAGVITVLLPDAFISSYLGGGLSSMLLMLVIGIPLYICATASTPIAAAFLLKGVSPGTALVFLLVGPATNITSLSVLVGLLGKRAVALYLTSIAFVSVFCGLILDAVYSMLGISVVAAVAKHGELVPEQLSLAATLFLLVFSLRPIKNSLQRRFGQKQGGSAGGTSCGCGHKELVVPLQPLSDLRKSS